ncbi:MAG: hypothetical protein JWO59_3170 [Chloroflexi bacterium]|nr:hypothetical protein [Chloroflexota bacterium]
MVLVGSGIHTDSGHCSGQSSVDHGYTSLMWLHELGEQTFSREERKFLSRAGRANVPVDVLVDRVQAIIGPDQPERGRQTFLAKRLLEEKLFGTFEEAYDFADSFYTLAKAGPLSKHLLWDWE